MILLVAQSLHSIIIPVEHLLPYSLARAISLAPILVIIDNCAHVREIEEIITELGNIYCLRRSASVLVFFAHIAHPIVEIYTDNL